MREHATAQGSHDQTLRVTASAGLAQEADEIAADSQQETRLLLR